MIVYKEKGSACNYPLLGRLRFMMEAIRPELRQYFWESDKDELPIRAIKDQWFINARKDCLPLGRLAPMKIITPMTLIG